MGRPSKLHFHGGVWESTIAGKTYYFGTDERKAKAEFHRVMAKTLAMPASDRPETVAGVVTRWLLINSRTCYTLWLKDFLTREGRTFLTDVGRDFITRYFVHLRTRTYTRGNGKKAKRHKLSDETIRHYTRAVTAVVRFAHEQGWIDEVPSVPSLPTAVRKSRDVSSQRLREILDSLPKRAGRILKFIAYTGCRPSEACRLKWEEIRLDVGVCLLAEHKTSQATGTPRTIYLTPDADAILRGTEGDKGYVFTSRLGTPYTTAGLRAILKRHSEITPYALRHTFAQAATDQGMPTEVLQALMGHRTGRMLSFYRQVRDARAIEIASRFRVVHAG